MRADGADDSVRLRGRRFADNFALRRDRAADLIAINAGILRQEAHDINAPPVAFPVIEALDRQGLLRAGEGGRQVDLRPRVRQGLSAEAQFKRFILFHAHVFFPLCLSLSHAPREAVRTALLCVLKVISNVPLQRMPHAPLAEPCVLPSDGVADARKHGIAALFLPVAQAEVDDAAAKRVLIRICAPAGKPDGGRYRGDGCESIRLRRAPQAEQPRQRISAKDDGRIRRNRVLRAHFRHQAHPKPIQRIRRAVPEGFPAEHRRRVPRGQIHIPRFHRKRDVQEAPRCLRGKQRHFLRKRVPRVNRLKQQNIRLIAQGDKAAFLRQRFGGREQIRHIRTTFPLDCIQYTRFARKAQVILIRF